MDLTIYTGATDKTIAAVTSATNTTPVTALEQLVLGDNAPLSVTFTDGTAAPSWAGSPGYTMAVGLGIPDINGQSDCVFEDEVTAITGGWSCTLDLTTQQIVDALALATGSAVDWTRYPLQSRMPRPRPLGGYFTLQIVVTDPDGNRVTYASLRVFVLNRVIDTATAVPQPPASYLTAAEIAALYSPRASGYGVQANASGNSTITPASTVANHTEIINVSGSSRTSAVVLATTGRTSGDRVINRLNLPTTANITIEWRNATAGGTLITSMVTDGSGDDAVGEFYFDGSAWQFLRFTLPANA